METGMDDSPAPPVNPPVALSFPVTKTLVLLNLAGFVATQIAPASHQHWLLPWGAEWGPLTLDGQWWRLLTSMFLHDGWAHVLGNMWCLWVLGKMAEQVFDKWSFLSTYLMSGLAGSVLCLAMHPTAISTGASGAIFGVAGMLVAALLMGRLHEPARALKWRIWPFLIFMALSLYPSAPDSEVDNAAHIGGFLAGLMLGLLLIKLESKTSRLSTRAPILVSAGMSVLLIAGIFLVWRANNDVIPLAAADASLEAGRLEEASRNLNLVLATRPDDLMANLMICRVFIKQEDYAKAEATAFRVLQAHPRHRGALMLWMFTRSLTAPPRRP